MKKIIVLISILSVTLFYSCKKNDSPGDNFGFGNNLPPYVTIESLDDIAAAPGDTVNITLQMRTSIQQTVTATYSAVGAVNVPNGTVVFNKEAKEATVSFILPANLITPPSTSASFVFTLVKAQTADGKALTIGQDANASAQKVNVLIEP